MSSLDAFVPQNGSTHDESGFVDAKWKAPAPGVMKVNVDATSTAIRVNGLGVMIRDHRGDAIMAMGHRISARQEPAVAESLAIRLGIETAKSIMHGSSFP
ncbi:hypothetical protein AKJ16_DCAP25357 [Drosera capensis]